MPKCMRRVTTTVGTADHGLPVAVESPISPVMDALNENSVLDYHPDTLKFIRKEYGLDGPGRMDEAINVLEEWMKKQEHFIVKSFPRSILERVIINNKGSLESSKRKLDRACTFRTVLPDFFGSLNLNDYTGYKMVTHTLLRKMTPDYGRLILVECYGDKFEQLVHCYKYFILICEYIQTYDYTTGVRIVMDCRQMNIAEFVRCASFVDMKKAIDIAIEGYSMRIKGIHLISESVAIDLIVALLRKLFKAKIGQRIYCHKNLESLYELVPKDILPKEYGGTDKSIPELRDNLLNAIRSTDFVEHCNEMNKARTNENYRSTAEFNEEYMGMSGTFRTLTVD